MNFEGPSNNIENQETEQLYAEFIRISDKLIEASDNLNQEQKGKFSPQLMERIAQVQKIFTPRSEKEVGDGILHNVGRNPGYEDLKEKSKNPTL
jgi:hypothetical protein